MLESNSLQDNTHQATAAKKAHDQIIVAATFTADPLQEILNFWFTQLGLHLKISFADYNQVFQQLLNPMSEMAQSAQGINLILIRVEDWLRFQSPEEKSDATVSKHVLERNSQELIRALAEAVRRTSVPYIVVFCPSNPRLAQEQLEVYQHIENTMVDALLDINNLYIIASKDVFSKYPVSHFYNAQSDRIGHIPFTPEAFAAMGTIIVRTIDALKRSPYKVIALDCDRTLWGGICGEDGPEGIVVDQPFQILQSFMLRCSKAGFLLCLCSKNVEEDVWHVFNQRKDMPLGREHLVGWRINWQPKSENLKSLAKELNLGLDSFIFIDDNPVECSEVQAHCPEVLTLQLPEDPKQIPTFLQHIWPLDTLKLTAADKNRTQLYKQNAARQQFAQQASDFKAFLQGLQLDIRIAPPSSEQLARVSQLTQRTNQFNATTRRRDDSEIRQLCTPQSGYGCLSVTVKDRFGDYGLVGVIIFQIQTDTLDVDTFLLSCRVLGRGIEHQMVAHLGAIAAKNSCSTVTLNYRPTSKNLPVANFFQAIDKPNTHQTPDKQQYILPTHTATELAHEAIEPSHITHSSSKTASHPNTHTSSNPTNNNNLAPQASKSARWHKIVHELRQPSQILEHITHQTQQSRSDRTPFLSPQTDTEKQLGDIWQQVLRLDRVSRNDNFFELGGTSLLAVNIFTEIEAKFHKRLPITTLLEASTLEKLATLLDRNQGQRWNPLVTVRASGSKPPLYIVHGGYGDVLSTAKIVDYLDEEQPLYLIRGIGLDGYQQPKSSLEAMANTYIEAIKQIQPQGPYQIAGRCSGGIVAFEMAQKLQHQGDLVSFLGLLDTPHPQLDNHFASRSRYYFHKPTYRHHLWDLTYYLFTTIYLSRRIAASLHYHWHQANQLSLTKQLKYFKETVVRFYNQAMGRVTSRQPSHLNHATYAPKTKNNLPLERVDNASNLPSTKTFIKDRFVETFLRAQKNYIPQYYSGKIDFFLTTRHSVVPKYPPTSLQSFINKPKPVKNIDQLLFGWDKVVAPGDFQIRCVDCPHPAMFETPYIKSLTQAIQVAIEQRSEVATAQHQKAIAINSR